ncbi:RimJ/RimL family protein N-acetyltransferase [Anaerosolibacter carboniphilus]|uniref:RimJ/RimL family protein N-acetyltransferase n=1 Tax=Anaerosolibacter carboniphilus TaxID=1417629 RepID=A0A841KUQ0_9FIRM|nr:GNAT family protein [Anaerosolibacter carboniphilus]MBB6217376.1 RimJ/RimL family protein N-acetyltransferase [Anaerosolibacter carboniphilus]
MKDWISQSDRILIRTTAENDLSYVLEAEQGTENSPYVAQWTKEQHQDAMKDQDILHLIIEDRIEKRAIGYAIIAGFESIHKSIELRRIVITEKGKGFGREALRLIKVLAFEKYKAHRLWLDVRQHNFRAQTLYLSEGFVKEGLLRECVLYKGRYESIWIMSILEEEYLKAK